MLVAEYAMVKAIKYVDGLLLVFTDIAQELVLLVWALMHQFQTFEAMILRVTRILLITF